MNRSLNIRSAVVSEYERLSALWKSVEYLHHDSLPHIFREPDAVWPTRSAVESLLVGPDSTILIAETANEIAGFITLNIHHVPVTQHLRARRFVMIENMAVDPLHRRRGIGRSLLRAAAEWTAQRGIDVLQLFVWEFNDAAACFYQSEGFMTELRGMARRLELAEPLK